LVFGVGVVVSSLVQADGPPPLPVFNWFLFDDTNVVDACGSPPGRHGCAGDPVLAVVPSAGLVYLAGTSPRQTDAYRGIMCWESTNNGVTFSQQTTVRVDITSLDKPWMAIDDWPELQQHDI
jgi:hypothetical protein